MSTSKQKSALTSAAISSSPQENSWLALRAAKEKAALVGDNFRVSSELVALYSKARTYFGAKY